MFSSFQTYMVAACTFYTVLVRNQHVVDPKVVLLVAGAGL